MPLDYLNWFAMRDTRKVDIRQTNYIIHSKLRILPNFTLFYRKILKLTKG